MSDTANVFHENIFQQKPDPDTFGGRLLRAREATGLSVKDLAWRLGVMIATVQGWESDRAQPSSHRLATLAGMLNVSLSWILHGVGTGAPDRDDASMSSVVDQQLSRLKHLHAQTGQLIGRIELDLERMQSSNAA